MALIECPECGKEISNAAFSCPNCGYIIPRERRGAYNKYVALFLCIFLDGVEHIGFTKEIHLWDFCIVLHLEFWGLDGFLILCELLQNQEHIMTHKF